MLNVQSYSPPLKASFNEKNMKLLLLCLLSVGLVEPQIWKRLLISPLQLENLFDVHSLKCDIQIILDVVGCDPTEAACESECNKVVTDGNVLEHGCPLVCHMIQNLAFYFHETPKPGEQNQACGGLGGLGGICKK